MGGRAKGGVTDVGWVEQIGEGKIAAGGKPGGMEPALDVGQREWSTLKITVG